MNRVETVPTVRISTEGGRTGLTWVALPREDLARELVGQMEIAERRDVSPETVRGWRKRGGFPEPIATVSGTPVWLWSDVEEFHPNPAGRPRKEAV